MLLKSSKLNEFRLWGLLLTLIGMTIMILGTSGLIFLGEKGRVLISIFLVVGMLVMLGSIAIYFWAGILSTSAKVIDCPKCGKRTKMLGTTDRCMFCKAALSFDKKYATEETS